MTSCLNQTQDIDLNYNRNSIIIRSMEAIFLILSSIMYSGIMYKMKGKKIFNSKFCCYKKNILTLKETLILEIANEFFVMIFVILVDHLNYFVFYCISYTVYCIILYFLAPILLLISLRKTCPEFYSNNLKSTGSSEKDFYAICKPSNLEPRRALFGGITGNTPNMFFMSNLLLYIKR